MHACARRELVQDLAVAHGRGGSVGRIEELADRIASDQIVAVDGPANPAARLRGRSTGDRVEAVFTTADMLSLEAAMVDHAVGREGKGAGRAADELRALGGFDSYAIHGLLHDLDRGGDYGFVDRTVLVVDEAGMVGSRQLSRLLDHAAEANAKVVLIGDERQLAAVEAGGGFKALADRLGAIELTEVYRQQHAWDRAALDQLRHGDISEWVAAYEQHGRLVPCQGADDQLHQLVSDWYVATGEHGLIETQMFAATREDAHALNQLGRAARSLPTSSTTPPPSQSATGCSQTAIVCWLGATSGYAPPTVPASTSYATATEAPSPPSTATQARCTSGSTMAPRSSSPTTTSSTADSPTATRRRSTRPRE